MLTAFAPVVGTEYIRVVRVVARSTLSGFVRNRVERGQRAVVKTQLDSWYDAVMKAEWKNSAELKAQFGSASIVSSERVVFNIKGNNYRLIVRVNYDYQAVRILWLGTHREYDKIDVREVEYDKERYADSTDTK
jgi:mRNA interferase HigB